MPPRPDLTRLLLTLVFLLIAADAAWAIPLDPDSGAALVLWAVVGFGSCLAAHEWKAFWLEADAYDAWRQEAEGE